MILKPPASSISSLPHTIPNFSPSPTHIPPPSSFSPPSPLNPSPNPTNNHPMVVRSKASIFKPKTFHTKLHSPIPITVHDTLTSPPWLQAMHDKYNALISNQTWILTSLPPCAKLVGCKWLFKNKYNADESFQRHKARLVA